jgi:hypothetical protein
MPLAAAEAAVVGLKAFYAPAVMAVVLVVAIMHLREQV